MLFRSVSQSRYLPNEAEPLHEAWEIRDRLEHHLDLVIDAGVCSEVPTTVIDLTDEVPKLLRQGGGDSAPFGF